MKHRARFRLAGIAIASLAWLARAAAATEFGVTPLVTDDQTAHPAQITDASLVNAWGVSESGTSGFWVSDNGTGVSTIYDVDPNTNATSKVGLTVTIPGAGNVTGQAFNAGAGFNGDRFLFVSEDGTISGWRGALGTTAEVLQTGLDSNRYKGSAIGTVGSDSYLYAANFASGQIDVLKGSSGSPNLAGSFLDPNLPAGYAPFNVQNLGGTLYVTYAVVGANGDDQSGAGHGIVDAFDLSGNLQSRIATGGALDSPWGLAIAPSSFGPFAGDLLVGNFGDGKVNAYDLATRTLAGTLSGPGATPLVIDGLWALIAGNGGNGGSADAIYFSAGPDGESHGLFGSITAVPEPDTLPLVACGLAGIAGVRARRDG